ncbi:MAG: hypothetical protein O2894_11740 [Planctomycetota bacterium]|nr:hypothetical protein [Planctomycetota bacterium]
MPRRRSSLRSHLATRLRLLVALIVSVFASASCRTYAGHPVLLSAPRLTADAVPPEPAATAEPAPAEAALMFLGLEGVLRHLKALHALPVAQGPAPHFERLPEVAASVQARFRDGGFGGAVRNVVVLGTTGFVPLAPKAMADLMQDPEVERQVLAASTFRREETLYALPGASRVRYRAELLQMGMGPIRFDLRFNIVSERRDLPGGRVWLRYDPAAEPANERVTLWRGGVLLEPIAGGQTRVSELVILGTDIQVAGPFLGPLLQLSRSTLENRATNLWRRAWQ